MAEQLRHKQSRRHSSSAIAIAKLLDCEGFSDHTANQLEKYWRNVSNLTVRQKLQLERMERAISEWCRDMPADKRLLLGKFVGLHKKMAFEVGLRMGLTCMAVRADQDFDVDDRHACDERKPPGANQCKST